MERRWGLAAGARGGDDEGDLGWRLCGGYGLGQGAIRCRSGRQQREEEEIIRLGIN